MTADGEANPGLVPVGAIGDAPVEQPVVEAKPVGDPLTGLDPRLNQHLGVIGAFVGGGPEKAGNIAFIVIAAALIVMVTASVASANITTAEFAPVMDKLISGCIALITGALGYVFGASKEGK